MAEREALPDDNQKTKITKKAFPCGKAFWPVMKAVTLSL
jgi:hypothetical protein